jgi:hypothetical protein
MPGDALLASQVALWLVVIANLLITLALVRRVNSERVRARPGLALGAIAPNFSAETLDGEPVSASTFEERTAFVFVAPTCQPCIESMPEYVRLGTLARTTPPALVLVSSGDAESTRQLLKEAQVSPRIIVAPRNKSDFFEQYKANSTPHFTLVENGRVTMVGAPYSSDGGWATLVSEWERSNRSAAATSRR